MSTLKTDSVQPTLIGNHLIFRTGADVERFRIQDNGQMLVASTTGTTFAGEVNFSSTTRFQGGILVGGGIGSTKYTALDVVHTNTSVLSPVQGNYSGTRSRSNAFIKPSGNDITLFFGNAGTSAAWLQVQNSDDTQRGLALNPVGGNVGIGTTGPIYDLDVKGTGRFYNTNNQTKLLVEGYATTYGYGIQFTQQPGSLDTATHPCRFMYKDGTTQVGLITTTSSSTTYGTSSDYRLKNNPTHLTGALTRVMMLKPSSYTWKIDDSYGEGFVAHELAEVVPLAVTGEKDAVDEHGNINPQSVDLSRVVPVLTAAIKELKAIVDAQAAEISQLKAK